MKFVTKCLGTGAALAFVSVPALAAGSSQAVDEKPMQHQIQQDFDQNAQQVTQARAQQVADQSQQIAPDQTQQVADQSQQVAPDQAQQADQSQQMTQDQMQQVQQSQGLIVRVTQDEHGVAQQEVRVVTEDVDPASLTPEEVEAVFASAYDVSGIPLRDADDGGMVTEDRRYAGFGYRPYRRPYYGPFNPYGPIVYRNPYYYPYPGRGIWYYPRWR